MPADAPLPLPDRPLAGRSIRWGLVGCGDVTERKSGPAFRQIPGSDLVAVMRRSPGLAEDYARRHGVPRWTDDADALINDPDVDSVYVATPPGSHLEIARRVAAAGKPCYVEKPIARSAAEGQAMVAAFEAAGVPLFVAFYRRAWDRVTRVRDVIRSGEIGTVTSVESVYARPSRDDDPAALPWRLRAEQSGGGLFVDLASHALDLVDFLLGPLADVSGVAVRGTAAYDVEQSAAFAFRTGSAVGAEAVGSGRWSFAADRAEDRLTIVGTTGRVSLPVFGAAPVVVETAAGRVEHDVPPPDPVQLPMIASVVAALRGEAAPLCTGADAVRTAAVIDTILGPYYGGRGDAFWERPETWPGARR